MKKLTFSLFLAIITIFSISIAASAIKLRAPNGMVTLNFSNGNVVCSTSCIGNSSTDELDATLTLYKNNIYVNSWSDSGTGYLSFGDDHENAIHGKTYRLTLTWAVNGVSQPSISTEKYYT